MLTAGALSVVVGDVPGLQNAMAAATGVTGDPFGRRRPARRRLSP